MKFSSLFNEITIIIIINFALWIVICKQQKNIKEIEKNWKHKKNYLWIYFFFLFVFGMYVDLLYTNDEKRGEEERENAE